MKYVLGIPGVEDYKFAHRGSVVHNVLESYYKNKSLTTKNLKKLFEEEWKKYDLENTSIKKLKNQTWEMIKKGYDLNIDNTSTELKLEYPDIIGFIDLVDENTQTLYDWKSSTRREENEKSYTRQLKLYAWLYYRKYSKLPKKLVVVYLKYEEEKEVFLKHTPTMKDVDYIKNWHVNIRKQMQKYVDNPTTLPDFNKEYHWSPYKHYWEKSDEEVLNYNLQIKDAYINIKNEVDDFLINHLDKKFSYEVVNKYLLRKKIRGAKKTIKFFNKNYQSLPIGFREELLKTLKEYGDYKNKPSKIQISDNRVFDETTIKTPNKLLTGKTLRPYQLDAVNTYLNKHKEGVLQITTGGGKSLIIAEIIRRLKIKTLFVVDKKELMYQMKETLEEELGLEIGVLGDSKNVLKDVTVSTIQTINSKKDLYKDFLKTVRLVVFDETHHVSSQSYKSLNSLLKNCEYRLGVSATAKRDDGHDMSIKSVVGDIVYSLTGQELIKQGYLMKPKIFFIKNINTQMQIDKMISDSGTGLINEDVDYNRYYQRFVIENKQRNTSIIKQVMNNNGKKVLLLVKYVRHGEALKKMFKGSEYLEGDTDAKKRGEIMNSFKEKDLNILISTLSIFSEGIDIPKLDVVINASANKGDVKSIQALGRVLRKHSGKKEAVYIDFYDEGSIFYNATRSRVKAFKKEGHEVLYV